MDYRLLKDIITGLNNKTLTCEQLLTESLQHIKKYDPILGAFISLNNTDSLFEQAKESDLRWSSGNPKSLIDGIPIAVKDNIHVTGFKTTCGSQILENYHPPFNATCINLIKKNGGIIIGKTNLDEFAMGSTTENSSLKKTRNPHDLERVPGGSSGGSVVSVAAGMTPLALGSDTGGSIRQPASFCGVTGLKPTYGLVSRYGLVAYASSLDQIGPIANDVYGIAILLNIISEFDEKDSTSLESEKRDYTSMIAKDIKGKKIAVFPELCTQGIDPEIMKTFQASLDILRENGAEITEVSFNVIDYVIAAYYFIATAEACSNLARYDGVKYGLRSEQQENYQQMLFSTRDQGFGEEVKKRILLGNFVLSSGYYDAYYRKAQKVRSLVREKVKKVLQKFDCIATPTTPEIAFKFGEKDKNPLNIYLSDITTVLPNLCGLPAISIPAGKTKNMPVGFQLIGNPLDESMLIQVAASLEKSQSIDYNPDFTKINISEENKNEDKSVTNITDAQSIANLYSSESISKISQSYKQSKKEVSVRVLCADLKNHIGQKIICSGWIHRKKNLGGIEFYIIRDRSGLTQLVLEGLKYQSDLNLETVIEAQGLVTEEERSPFENIEIKVSEIKVLGQSAEDIPININVPLDKVNLPTILDNRPISIRNLKVRKTFEIQGEIVRLFAEYLRKQNFTEIKSPKIIYSGTEGGTNIFEIKYFDRSAFLAQSPQFYKQIMVGSGFERVFETGPVFRAEHHDTIRHLNEYTSLDFEMGFIHNEQDVINMQEELLRYLFKGLKKKFANDIEELDLDLSFPQDIPRIHFLEACKIINTMGVKDIEEGDISTEGEKALHAYAQEHYNSHFIYIIGYPVKKRPMYTMADERLPGYTRSFDLLYKGIEITTGGQRIHDYHMLKESMLAFGCNPSDFKDYLLVFKYGMPPHGGLGMGLERLTMKILGYQNIRQASLFPRDINRIAP